jgi:hypothetical protein
MRVVYWTVETTDWTELLLNKGLPQRMSILEDENVGQTAAFVAIWCCQLSQCGGVWYYDTHTTSLAS